MKGLIRNNLYSMEGNIKTSFMLAAFLIFVPLFISEATILSMVVAVQIFIFVANVGTSLQADEVAKWNKFELTLPVKRSTVIAAKYISFLMLILLGFMMSVFTIVVYNLSATSLNMEALARGCHYGLMLAVITTAAMYPMMLKMGTEKNELIIMICALLSIPMMSLIAFALSVVTEGMNLHYSVVGAVSIVAALLLFAVSFSVSKQIYKNKEF